VEGQRRVAERPVDVHDGQVVDLAGEVDHLDQAPGQPVAVRGVPIDIHRKVPDACTELLLLSHFRAPIDVACVPSVAVRLGTGARHHVATMTCTPAASIAFSCFSSIPSSVTRTSTSPRSPRTQKERAPILLESATTKTRCADQIMARL